MDLKFAEEIVTEKELRFIGVIIDTEDSKASKYNGKKSQASSTKAQEKDPFNIENLNKSLYLLTNEVSELKRNSSEASTNNNYFKLYFKKNINQSTKFEQGSNVVFNVENLGMDNYYTFHQETNSKKTCPQWKHNMNVVVSNVIEFFSTK